MIKVDPIQFDQLIEALNKVDCPTIIISILGAAISAFVAYKVAKFQANKSDEQVQKQIDSQRELEKEMFFRQNKYEKIQLLIRDCDEIKIFCLNQMYNLFGLYDKHLSLDDLGGYKEVVFNRSLSPVLNISTSIIDIGFDEEETEIIKGLRLEEKYKDIVSKSQVVNSYLQLTYSTWGLEEKDKDKNYERYSESINFIKNLLNASLLLSIALEELDKYNLYRLTNRDIPTDYMEEAKKQIEEKYEKVKVPLQEELD